MAVLRLTQRPSYAEPGERQIHAEPGEKENPLSLVHGGSSLDSRSSLDSEDSPSLVHIPMEADLTEPNVYFTGGRSLSWLYIPMEASSVLINRARCVADYNRRSLSWLYIPMETSSVLINRARCVADYNGRSLSWLYIPMETSSVVRGGYISVIYFMAMFVFYFVQVHYAQKKVYLPPHKQTITLCQTLCVCISCCDLAFVFQAECLSRVCRLRSSR